MKDPSIALDEQLVAYSLQPEDEKVRNELLRLAELTGRWEEVLRTEADLYRLTPDPGRRLVIALRAAALAEQKLRDPLRAFRGYLAALHLAPDDDEIAAHLSRLALAIDAGQPSPPRSAVEELATVLEKLPTNEPLGRLLDIANLFKRDGAADARRLAALERAAAIDPSEARIAAEILEWDPPPELLDRGCALCQLLAEEALDSRSAVNLRLKLARIRERQGQVEEAEEEMRTALGIDPGCSMALEWLEQRYRAQERWADLAAHLERRSVQPRSPKRREILQELASIYEQQLRKPADAVSALERLAAETPSSTELHASRARLYERMEQWAKAADALNEVARSSERSRAQEALRRMAEIYERQLRLPERALETYRAIIERDASDEASASAYAGLLESLGHWKDLETFLRRQVARAQGETRERLLRQRITVLEEKLGDSMAAAAALRDLRSLIPADPGVHSRLVENLRRGGRFREVATLLLERITASEKQGVPAAEVADLLCQLGALQANELGDRAGARRSFERGLSVLPDHVSTLRESAHLYLREEDYPSFARVKQREAELCTDPAAAIALELELARILRERGGNREASSAALQRALDRDPVNEAALSALLEMAVEEQRWEDAHVLAEELLEIAVAPLAKAKILVVLARVARQLGNTEEAQQRADEALALDSECLEAVKERAELHLAANRIADAEQILQAALGGPRRDQAGAASLFVLLGVCYGRQQQLDKGFRALLEADRLRPGHLLTRLAMGENRYRAHQWHEASLHLGLIGHPDAPMHAKAMAPAYVHAAVAETRLRRPDKAAALFEAALCMQPDYVPALRALRELADAAGDRRASADYLEREGRATGDVNLCQRAGDAWIALGEPASARRAYAEGRAQAQARGLAIPSALLEKLLDLEREAGDLEAAWASSQLAVRTSEDPAMRAARRRSAAEIALARGDREAVLAQLRAAIDEDESDDASLLAWGEHEEARVVLEELERRLPRLPEPTSAEARRGRAALWRRLSELRRSIAESPRGAIEALERAVRLDSTLRSELVDVYSQTGEQSRSALGHHRELLADDILRVPSLRALARTYVEQFEAVRARCVYQVIELLTEPTDEERAWISAHPAPVMDPDDAYPDVLDDADHARLAHPDARTLAEVLGALYEGAPNLAGANFASYGCTPQERLSPISDVPVAPVFGQVGRMLGNRKTGLYLKTDRGLDGIALISQPPTGVVVGRRIAFQTQPADLRFLLGRALELLRPEYILAETAEKKQFAHLFRALLAAFHPRHTRTASDVPLAGQLRKTLPVAITRRLSEMLGEKTELPWSSARWRLAVRQSANRIGLIACGDLATSVRILVCENEPDLPDRPSPTELASLVERSPIVADLLRFAISEEYLSARAKVLGDRG